MYCRWCGAENLEESRFCSNCGKSLIPEQTSPVNQTTSENNYQNNSPAYQQKSVDNTIMPLNIFCIILCFIGAATFFLPIVEATGYNSSTMEYYTIGYSGFDLLLDYDFDQGGIYESFPSLARAAPLFISLLYIVAMYLFYTCFNRQPGKEIPIILFIILFLSFSISMAVSSTPVYENSYLREYLHNGIGETILAWDTIAVLIIGYILGKKLEKTDLPK